MPNTRFGLQEMARPVIVYFHFSQCDLLNISVFRKNKSFAKEYASDLNDPEHQNEIFLMAKQMVKERHHITGSNCLKGVSGKITADENVPSVL